MPPPELDAASVMDTTMLTETAYAKVNLALHVRARRADGYHELESLFVFAEHGDRLRATRRADDALRLSIDGPFAGDLDEGTGNLVMKAAVALRALAGNEGLGAEIRLTKMLPVASGIGGGSADAAATLRILVVLWNLTIPQADLLALSLSLGSDVPACLDSENRFVRGRGEILEAQPVQGLEGLPILLVNPGVPVSTGQVFGAWDGIDRGPLRAGDIGDLIARAGNDLETAAINCAPVIALVLDMLKAQSGVRLARMSGSGATCFALFDDADFMSAAAARIEAAFPQWWVMATRIRG